MKTNVGLIGVGELGIAVAKNMLKEGHDLTVFDTRPEIVADCVERGAKAASSAAELAASVDVVVQPSPPHLLLKTSSSAVEAF